MRERPILFSGEMVRAILAGNKTHTRRVMKPQPLFVKQRSCIGIWTWKGYEWKYGERIHDEILTAMIKNYGPYIQGDRLWLRETWLPHDAKRIEDKVVFLPSGPSGEKFVYKADDPDYDYGPFSKGWRPSIHMPRAASRITLEVDCVRVERVNDITEDDAKAEGAERQKITPTMLGTHRDGFVELWNSINAKRGYGWDDNPWTWVVEFKLLEVNQK